MTRRFLTAALAVFATLPLLAQGGRPTGGGAGRPDFLAGYLGLSDSQKQQAQAIFSAAEQPIQTAMGQLTSARDALRAAVKAGAPDAELDRLAAAQGAIEGQLAAIHAKSSAKLYAILTPEQKAKYDEMGSRGGFGGGPGGRGMRGGRK